MGYLSDNSKLYLVLGPYLLNYGAMLGHYFSFVIGWQHLSLLSLFVLLDYPSAIGLWASSLPDNIILNAANKQTNQCLSPFRAVYFPWRGFPGFPSFRNA